jgi:hypothetical protein
MLTKTRGAESAGYEIILYSDQYIGEAKINEGRAAIPSSGIRGRMALFRRIWTRRLITCAK